jgi:peroxiredoxin
MEAALLVVVILLFALMVGSWVVIYQLLKQQGRLILHLDEVERQIKVFNRPRDKVQWGVDDAPVHPIEITVGKQFPPFRLSDLNGEVFNLDDLMAKRVLLIHWSPKSEFCTLIAPNLARLQTELKAHDVRLLLVSAQVRELNQQMAQAFGLECPVLLMNAQDQFTIFRGMGTPVAYLLNEEHCVIYPLAVGADQVLTLAREAVVSASVSKPRPHLRDVSESRIERDGLKAGTPAPLFHLPTIDGDTVSLEAYRGRRVLLVFTSPSCAPCDYLVPHLVKLHQQHSNTDLAFLMIGRGDPEENRRKAAAHGYTFPVALQNRWEISRLYGIFSTPVAFLIDENGVIVANIAKGTHEILALARDELKEEVRDESI